MRPDRLKRLITGVAVPYIVFETAYSLFKRYADHDPGMEISLLDPWFLTWFLVALFIWRLTTPIWNLVRWPLPLALGIAMLASVTPGIGDDLDLQRVLQFLPYFVLGLVMKPEHFRMVQPALGADRGGAGVRGGPRRRLVGGAAHEHRVVLPPRRRPGHGRALVDGTGHGAGHVRRLAAADGLLLRLGAEWRMWFTALGAGTLYGYLLHGFLIKGAGFAGWFDQAWLHRPLGEIFVSALAAVAVTLLCTSPVRRVFRFVMEPDMNWAFRRDAAEAVRGREAPRKTAPRETVDA